MLSPAAVSFTNAADPLGQIFGGVAEGRMIAGDFNNDGDVDFLYQAGNTAGTGFGYLSNNGGGSFTNVTNANAAGTPFTSFNFASQQMASASLFVFDYDKDGDVDIIDRDNTGAGNTLGLWRNDAGSFTNQPDPIGQINAGTAEGRMIFGDFDNDGDIDLLYQAGNTAGTAFGFIRNNGAGVFTIVTNANSAGTPFTSFNFTGQLLTAASLFVTDYDNDGDVDIIDRDNSGAGNTLGLWRNDAGSFTNQADPLGLINAGVAEGRMVRGDFDSDGDVDFLYQVSNTAGAGFGYFRNGGAGTFTNVSNANSAGSPFASFNFASQQLSTTSFFVVDYDYDGDVDIIDRDNSGAGNTLSAWRQGSDSGGDGSPPVIASSNPADNATGVSTIANIQITFDESVTKGTGNIRIVRTSDSVTVETIPVGDARVTGSGTTWTINPNITLAYNTSYAVRFDLGTFVDTDGAVFFGVTNNTSLNFTTFGPTAASVTIGGRIMTAAGNGIGKTTVALTDVNGNSRYTVTGPFGYYSFEDVAIGAYVIGVSAKSYDFSQNSMALSVSEDQLNVNFFSLP